MKGLDEFLAVFGDITILDATKFLIAIGFIIAAYMKFKKYIKAKQDTEIERREAEKLKDEQLAEALEGVRKYPEYRQQSIEIQKQINKDLQGLKERFESDMQDLKNRMEEIEDSNREREQHKLRDKLLSHYRYYTNPETNPTLSWTEMEADAFWKLASEYEKTGGNGDVHNNVFPAMRRLHIIKHENQW